MLSETSSDVVASLSNAELAALPTWLVVAAVVAVLASLLLCAACCCHCSRRRRKRIALGAVIKHRARGYSDELHDLTPRSQARARSAREAADSRDCLCHDGDHMAAAGLSAVSPKRGSALSRLSRSTDKQSIKDDNDDYMYGSDDDGRASDPFPAAERQRSHTLGASIDLGVESCLSEDARARLAAARASRVSRVSRESDGSAKSEAGTSPDFRLRSLSIPEEPPRAESIPRTEAEFLATARATVAAQRRVSASAGSSAPYLTANEEARLIRDEVKRLRGLATAALAAVAFRSEARAGAAPTATRDDRSTSTPDRMSTTQHACAIRL